MKYIGLGLLVMGIVLASGVYYLLQPLGKVSDFSKWQAMPYTATPTGLKVSFFGVSTLLFDDGTDQILIDGFFSRAPLQHVIFSKLSGDLAYLNKWVQQYDLKRTRAILVTHSHYDHALDLANLTMLLSNSQVIGSQTSLNIARANQHVNEQKLTLAIPFQTQVFGAFKITPIPSVHTPPTPVNDDLGEEITSPFQLPAKFSAFKEGGSFDYLIEHQGQRILVKASTGFIPNQFKNLNVDTLFLGVAQLSRQSETYQHQYLNETIGRLKPQTVIPIHWDDFFQPLNQALIFLPRLADDVPKSLNRLIDFAQKQQTQVVLITDTQSYALNTLKPSHNP